MPVFHDRNHAAGKYEGSPRKIPDIPYLAFWIQKLNTFASAARSIKWGPPSNTMFGEKLASST
jgi:hypothetical protein